MITLDDITTILQDDLSVLNEKKESYKNNYEKTVNKINKDYELAVADNNRKYQDEQDILEVNLVDIKDKLKRRLEKAKSDLEEKLKQLEKTIQGVIESKKKSLEEQMNTEEKEDKEQSILTKSLNNKILSEIN